MEYTLHKPRQPVHLVIEFDDAAEAKALREELQTWTPSGGWSPLAKEFFKALEEAGSGS